MQQIAEEAGYTVASLYSYFEGKQEIFDGLVAMLAQGLLGPFDEELPAGLTFSHRLELLLRRQLEFAEQCREELTLFFSLKSGAGATPRLPEPDLYVRRLTDWIERAACAEDIGGRTPEETAYLLKGIMQAVFTQWLRNGGRDRLADRAGLIVEILLHGLLGRVRERAAPPARGG